jgi:hypothetical protein
LPNKTAKGKKKNSMSRLIARNVDGSVEGKACFHVDSERGNHFWTFESVTSVENKADMENKGRGNKVSRKRYKDGVEGSLVKVPNFEIA